ncbi:MAG TPA: SIMPL domain-containing protein [Bacillota bacterium]|nr:SIMPL domain-containing protein [Bacillota bacterium]
MKKYRVFQSFALSVGILAFTSVVPSTSNLAFADENQQKTIHVGGEGKVNVSPDVAYIELGVQSQKNTVSEAQAENTNALEQIYAALDQEKIKKEEIQTVSYSVNPIYTWDQNKQVFQGYQVVHMLRITDRDLAGIGEVIDNATKAGANRVDHIQFDTEKRQEYELKALDLAMDDASQKANFLAGKIGQSIQSVISIQENGGSYVPRYASFAPSPASGGGAAATQVSVGEITITTNVDVLYGF